MEELSKLRDDLYEALPSGELDAFELIKLIKNHITKLDELIELKKLRVGDVVGRSEQFICDHCDTGFKDMSKEVVLDFDCYNKLTSK